MEKNPNTTGEEALSQKLDELLAELDMEENGKFCFPEEKVEEMMSELYKEITFSISHVPLNPPIFMDDAKNESCGALVSSSKSTMMAGIEIASSTDRFLVKKNGFRKEKNDRRKNVFHNEDHLDCEWVGSVFRNWLF